MIKKQNRKMRQMREQYRINLTDTHKKSHCFITSDNHKISFDVDGLKVSKGVRLLTVRVNNSH